MLALVAEEYEMPLGLKEFQDIINERPVPPLSFIPLSEEEEVYAIGMFYYFSFISTNIFS